MIIGFENTDKQKTDIFDAPNVRVLVNGEDELVVDAFTLKGDGLGDICIGSDYEFYVTSAAEWDACDQKINKQEFVEILKYAILSKASVCLAYSEKEKKIKVIGCR